MHRSIFSGIDNGGPSEGDCIFHRKMTAYFNSEIAGKKNEEMENSDASIVDIASSSSFFSNALTFLPSFRHIFDFKLTDFFLVKPYEKVPLDWLTFLSSGKGIDDDDDANGGSVIGGDGVGRFPSELDRHLWPKELADFVDEATRLTIPKCVQDEARLSRFLIPAISTKGFSPKKIHEVSRFAAFLNHLISTEFDETSTEDAVVGRSKEDVVIVDVGSGLGYLGQILSASFGYNVINVESELSHCQGARRRQQQQQQKQQNSQNSQPPPLVKATETNASPLRTDDVTTTKTTSSSTNATFTPAPTIFNPTIVNLHASLSDDVASFDQFDDCIRECITTKMMKDPEKMIVVLTGLHACGDLTPTMLKLFCRRGVGGGEDEARRTKLVYRAIAVVGCCYHRMSTFSGSEVDVDREATANAVRRENDFSNSRLYRLFPLSSSLFEVFRTTTETDEIDNSTTTGGDAINAVEEDEYSSFRLINAFALRLAAQEAMSRWRRQTSTDHAQHARHVAFRAVLQVAISKMTSDRNVTSLGVGGDGITKLHKKLVAGKKTSFSNFDAYKASLRSRIEPTRTTTTTKNADHGSWWSEMERALDESYEELSREFLWIEPLTFLQFCLQGVLESLLLKDRLAFLKEMGVANSRLVPIFDDAISPRNVVIVATRLTRTDGETDAEN